ncbi:uncharacterized protein TNCV_1187381 [Trichonephila clavipes]|nr:uncharacterized protein TNCV_1187381 [Trichonephila clavipes]
MSRLKRPPAGGEVVPAQVLRSLLHHGAGLTVAKSPGGCDSPVVKISDHGRHVMSSSPVPLKTHCVGHRCTLNLSRTEMSSRWCGVVIRRGVETQVSFTSLDHSSKLRGPSPKSLV